MPLRSFYSSPDWLPSDSGYLAWSGDPALASASATVAAGVLQIAKLKITKGGLVTNIHLNNPVAGATLTAGQCFAGLADPSGVLLSGSASLDGVFSTGTGVKNIPLTTPQTIGAGLYEVWFYSNGTTQPTFRAFSASGPTADSGLSIANSRFGTANTGLTTALPTTRSVIATQQSSFWVALS